MSIAAAFSRSLTISTSLRRAAAPVAVRPPGQRIALARDAAFSFIYPHLVQGWRAAGAEIVPFSPLADEPPPSDCDVCWLPGGYPELHAGRLAAAARFRDGLRRFAETRPVHGECGGYMALGQSLTDASGVAHPMAGLLGVETSFEKRRMTLGYREARIASDCALGGAGRSSCAATSSTMRPSSQAAAMILSPLFATSMARRKRRRAREGAGSRGRFSMSSPRRDAQAADAAPAPPRSRAFPASAKKPSSAGARMACASFAAAGRLVKLGERVRGQERIAAGALRAGDGDGGLKRFLGRTRIRRETASTGNRRAAGKDRSRCNALRSLPLSPVQHRSPRARSPGPRAWLRVPRADHKTPARRSYFLARDTRRALL